MKKLLIAAALITSTLSAHAQKPGEGFDGTNASCSNVGTTLFKGKTGLVPHLLAMTTNGMSGSTVLLAMTFNQLECDVDRPVASIRPFVDQNMDALATDMSRGQGETLVALASLLGVDSTNQNQFNATLQQQFAAVFADDQITSGQVANNIVAVLVNQAG